MPQTTTQPRAPGFQPLMQIDMDIGLFTSHWAYCDRVSSYVARMISHNRTDSLLYANLFSSAFNELLETVFRKHGTPGRFSCSVYRLAERDRIELTLPADPQVHGFYARAIEDLTADEAQDRYRDALFAPGPIEPGLGLLELAVDYQARIWLEQGDAHTLRLIAELALERSLD